MSDGYALLRAIEADPEEDTPRLAYADWLQEHAASDADRARAEFIRVQCELARSPDEKQKFALEARERALSRAHRKTWIRQLPPLWGKFRFHRGFIMSIPITSANFLQFGEALSEVSPIDSVWLAGDQHDIERLALSTLLLRVRHICVGYSDMGDNRFAALMSSPHLKNLVSLYAPSAQLGWAGCEALRVANLPGLRYLSLTDNPIGDDGLLALRRASWFAQLEELSIGNCQLSEAAIIDLVADPACAGLRKLSVRDIGHGEHVARAILASPYLARLDHLSLATPFDREVQQALESRFGKALRR